MHSDLNGFKTVLKAKRREMDLSMAAFGELIGRSAGSIHAYENGELPPASILPLLAKVLNLDLETLRQLVAVERTSQPAPSPKPDLSAGLSALGDLPAVDHSTAAPSAQEA